MKELEKAIGIWKIILSEDPSISGGEAEALRLVIEAAEDPQRHCPKCSKVHSRKTMQQELFDEGIDYAEIMSMDYEELMEATPPDTALVPSGLEDETCSTCEWFHKGEQVDHSHCVHKYGRNDMQMIHSGKRPACSLYKAKTEEGGKE